jgi:site-specific DNA recombinase
VTTSPRHTPIAVCCAIYGRKSTEEGLEQEFNSLDAQREAGEAYIASQRLSGWTCLADRYDDGGYTGGNMERPALAQLLRDIQAGKIQVVVVYKVDRLSRSLLDFARMMETFAKHQVSFVSVTQEFNTATSMGRLMLNVLLSFAQFEREIISERTRDKIAATRRKGKWSGGKPLLGYDVDPRGSRLVVNPKEAKNVRTIFGLYVHKQGLIPVVQELERRRWLTKRWITRKGHARGGKPFTKTSLHRLLTNVTYIGRLKYKNEVHKGEHAAILDKALWEQTQRILVSQGIQADATPSNYVETPLKGLLRCLPCGCAMTPSFAVKNRAQRYRYYVCCNAQRRGWRTCPSKSLPAAAIEQFTLQCVQGLLRDAERFHEAVDCACRQMEQLTSEKAMHDGDEASLVVAFPRCENDKIQRAQAHLASAWDNLPPEEQVRLLRLMIKRIDYDGVKGQAILNYQAAGLIALVEAWSDKPKEQSS